MHLWVTGFPMKAQTGHSHTNTNGVKLLICQEMATCEPAVITSAHARSNMTTQVFWLTGEAKNKPLQQHLPRLAQRIPVFPCWALLIRSSTDAHVRPPQPQLSREQVHLTQTQRPVVCALQKQLWVINTQTRIDEHKNTRMWMCTDRERHSSCSWAEGQNIPDSCEFLWRKDGGRMER